MLFIKIFRNKIIVDDNSITRIGLFYSKELTFAQIKGCRVGEKTIYIEPISPDDKRIVLNNYIDYSGSEELATFLRNTFTNLDEVDLKNAEEKLLHDNTLGMTEEDRQASLKKAKQISIAYNIIGFIVAIMAFFIPTKYVAFYITSIFPLIGIVVMLTSKGLIKLVSNKKTSPYPYIFFGVFFPLLIMFFISLREYELLEYKNYWLPFIGISTFFLVLLILTGINKTAKPIQGQIILMIVFSFLYGSGATTQINCIFDDSPVITYQTSVISKYISSGKGPHYHITLAPWLPHQKSREIDVSRSEYDQRPVDAPVTVYVKSGYIKIPWFYTDL